MPAGKVQKVKPLKVKIERFDPEHDPSPHLVEYEIPREEKMNVLRVLTYLYEEVDPTLTFRGPCRMTFCSLCRVRVNGKSLLACQRLLGEDEEEILIQPVEGYVPVRDLVVDLEAREEEEEELEDLSDHR